MPQYFDPQNLTPEQLGRWDAAMARYPQVLNENLEREIAAMTPAEEAGYLAQIRSVVPGDTTSLREHLQASIGIMDGGAGDSKSALFSRLLNGLPALRYPPPTSWSYPWYEVIEGVGPFAVSITGIPTLGGQVRGTQGAEGEFVLGINQCAWVTVPMNEAARRLMALQERVASLATPGTDDDHRCRYAWDSSLLEEVLAAYAGRPVFSVRYGLWGEYHLSLGRNETLAQRGYVLEEIAALARRDCANLAFCDNVFDAHEFLVNAKIGDVKIATEHPRMRLAQARARVAQMQDTAGVNDAGWADLRAIAAMEGTLEVDVARFEADPARQDMVGLSYECWMLKKSSLHAPFADDEVQRLNEWQTQTGSTFHGHPFTCKNRGDGQHGTEGGDRGILIATPAGWVCPHCSYTQIWAHAVMAAKQASVVAFFGSDGAFSPPKSAREMLARHLPAYQALAAQGKEGAAVMVECLLRRQHELDAEVKVAAESLSMWTVYDHPTDYPKEIVARKWRVDHGNIEPQPTQEVLKGQSLDAVRAQLPPGLLMMPRAPGDDPKIIETWF